MFVFVGFILGIISMAFVKIHLPKLSLLLGASEKLLMNCNQYLSIMMLFAPATILQTLFQSYFVTANRPSLGLALSVISGITNVFLDVFFILKLHLGIQGAALATGMGQIIPTIIGLYFFFFNQDDLYFVKFKINFSLLKEACYNGMSEMVSQLSGAVMTFLFNIVLMHFIGEKGVAAITILLYVEFLFNAFYLGFSTGISPIIGYKYGAKQKDELKMIYKTSFIFVIVSSFVLTIISLLSMQFLVGIFTQDQETYQITKMHLKSSFLIFYSVVLI
ncbi:MAG: MATE family efflux transporter [Bacillota bacterium]|nr:MATE family efflux transporter [Bacillota bacterium]